MSGILRIDTDMEQDDSSSCGSLSPLWSSNEDNIITVGAEGALARELVQVPVEEHLNEQTLFLEEHKENICALIRADQPGWEDRLSLALGRVLDIQGYRRVEHGEHRPVLQPALDPASWPPLA